MRLKSALLFLLCVVATAYRLPAEEALYVAKITSAPNMEVVPTPNVMERLVIFPLSEMFAKGMNSRGRRKVLAADYDVRFVCIRTKDPSHAAQTITQQISEQTGLMLKKHVNSSLARIAPTTVLQCFSDTAVITLVLTPKEPDVYVVSCSYLIDERPAGSIDGTAAGITEMQEEKKRMLQEFEAMRKAAAPK